MSPVGSLREYYWSDEEVKGCAGEGVRGCAGEDAACSFVRLFLCFFVLGSRVLVLGSWFSQRKQFFNRHKAKRAGGAGADAGEIIVSVAEIAFVGPMGWFRGFERNSSYVALLEFAP